jgi:hypothetical protein
MQQGDGAGSGGGIQGQQISSYPSGERQAMNANGP